MLVGAKTVVFFASLFRRAETDSISRVSDAKMLISRVLLRMSGTMRSGMPPSLLSPFLSRSWWEKRLCGLFTMIGFCCSYRGRFCGIWSRAKSLLLETRFFGKKRKEDANVTIEVRIIKYETQKVFI